MKRLSSISYKANGKVHTESIWIQRAEATDTVLVLQLFIDKETNKPVITESQDGVKQYQVSEFGENGRYAYISINAMKALLANGQVREINGSKWVALTLTPLSPTMEQFDKAPVVAKV